MFIRAADGHAAGSDPGGTMTDDPRKPPTGFPEPAGRDPGDRSKDPSPHHALNPPADEPDPTESPDPYDRREDPRAPLDDDAAGGGGGAGGGDGTPTGATSTSAPHPREDPEAIPAEGLKRDRVDD
jgi:hypothetical protein